MADCVIRSRIDPLIKAEASSINIPNAKTRVVLEAVEQGKHLQATSLVKLSKDWDAIKRKTV